MNSNTMLKILKSITYLTVPFINILLNCFIFKRVIGVVIRQAELIQHLLQCHSLSRIIRETATLSKIDSALVV